MAKIVFKHLAKKRKHRKRKFYDGKKFEKAMSKYLKRLKS